MTYICLGGCVTGLPTSMFSLTGFSVLGTEIKASLETEENTDFSSGLTTVAGTHQALATILD